MTEQIVKIRVVDNCGNDMGNLTISSRVKLDICLEEEIDSFKLFNIPIITNIEELDNKTPILYFTNESKLSPLLFLEETKYDVYFESEDLNADYEIFPDLNRNNANTFKEFNFDISSDSSYKTVGSLNFRSYVGKTFLNIRKNSQNSMPIPIEVRSKKLGYIDQFSKMIADLSQNSLGILFEFNSPLYQEFEISNSYKSSCYEYFMFLEFLFREENLPAVFEYLSKNLYSNLKSNSTDVPSYFASTVEINSLKRMISNPNNFVRITEDFPIDEMKGKFFPLSVEKINHEDSIDVLENRFLKYFLELIDELIITLLKKFEKKKKKGQVNDKLNEFHNEISYYLSFNFLSEISSLDYIPYNSQVLQKREGYRDIFNYYLMYAYSFYFNWDELENNFKGFEKKLSVLYEYWCYFRLLEALNNLSEIKINFEDLFKLSKDKWSINIKKGIKSKNKFKLNLKGKEILVYSYYNRLYSKKSEYKSYSLGFKPDYSLLIKINENKYLMHFDAKYRSELEIVDFYNRIDEKSEKEIESEVDDRNFEEGVSKIFKYADIYKMHTYKDSILKTEGAYVLYPGDVPANFLEGEFTIPSVGAFPLTPGNEKNENDLMIFIKRAIEDMVEFDISTKEFD